MSKQSEEKTEQHDARGTKPRQLAQPIDRCDAEHVERNGLSEEQAFVIPRIDCLAVAASVLRRLQREFQHPNVRADGREIDVERVENSAGRRLKIVESFA